MSPAKGTGWPYVYRMDSVSACVVYFLSVYLSPVISTPYSLDSVEPCTKAYLQLAGGASLAIRTMVGSSQLPQAPGLSGSYGCMRRGRGVRACTLVSEPPEIGVFGFDSGIST